MSAETPRRVTYRVTGRDQGVRLDLFLKERIPRLSREGIKEAIRSRVEVRGRSKVRPSTILRAGDEVLIAYPVARADQHGSAGAPQVAVLHEDDGLLVVDKPAGLIAHATPSSKGPTLMGVLAASTYGPLHLVHRLDRETSGVVVLAREPETARALSRAFATSQVRKTYAAIVFGEMAQEGGTIDLPLGKASGSAVHIKQGVDRISGRPARTDYRVVERLKGFTLLEVRPLTGRRHQIRVHLQAIGHPVVGDKLYAARESHHLRFRERGFDGAMRRDLLAERQLLHASRVEMIHPRDGRPVLFEAPLPAEMRSFLEERRAGRGVI